MLALSVREAFEQTISCLESGRATSGVDVGIQGGHSTDGNSIDFMQCALY